MRSDHAWAHRGDKEVRCGYSWSLELPVLQSLWDVLSSALHIKGATAHDRNIPWYHRGPKTPISNPQRSHLPACCISSRAATPPHEQSRATPASRRLSCESTQICERRSHMSLSHQGLPAWLSSLSHQSCSVTSTQMSPPHSDHPFVP